MRIFRDRATAEQVREFDELRRKPDPDSRDRDRALNLVLFQLTDPELRKINILPCDIRSQPDWVIAGSPMGGSVTEAFSRALEPEHISAEVVAVQDNVRIWVVPREQFFRARRALLAVPNLKALGVQLTEPMVSLD
jgi:hypothetical protein